MLEKIEETNKEFKLYESDEVKSLISSFEEIVSRLDKDNATLRDKLDELIVFSKESGKVNTDFVERVVSILSEFEVTLPKHLEVTVDNQVEIPTEVKISNLEKFPDIPEPVWTKESIAGVLAAIVEVKKQLAKDSNRVRRTVIENKTTREAIPVTLVDRRGREFYNAVMTAVAGGASVPFRDVGNNPKEALVKNDGTVVVEQSNQLDSITGAVTTIRYPHHEVHEGNHFYLEGYVELDTDETLYVKLVTPDSNKWAHFRWEVESSGIMETTFYEGVSGGMTGGSIATPLNSNRNSDTISVLTITKGVTVADNLGTIVAEKKVGGVGFKTVSGGSADRNDEMILKQNTTYLRKFESFSDANIISFRATWYEHTSL